MNDEAGPVANPHPPVRPFAGARKDGPRSDARSLRRQGWSIKRIAAEVGVSASSVSVWCADISLTDEQREALGAASRTAVTKRAASTRAARIRRTEMIHAQSAAEVCDVTHRDLFIAGVALYWAEGAKQKPWSSSTGVQLVNSDPSVVLVFVAFLELVGVPRDDLAFALAIHESADVGRALGYWAEQLGVDDGTIKVRLKRHNPKTRRHNIGDSYVGALIVTVRRSTDLNRRIEGWWRAISAALDWLP